MEKLLEQFAKSTTFEEQCDYARVWMMAQSWDKYLKWDEFSARDLILFYPCMEDDDTTIWMDNTPEDEKAKGTEAIEYIFGKLVRIAYD